MQLSLLTACLCKVPESPWFLATTGRLQGDLTQLATGYAKQWFSKPLGLAAGGLCTYSYVSM